MSTRLSNALLQTFDYYFPTDVEIEKYFFFIKESTILLI